MPSRSARLGLAGTAGSTLVVSLAVLALTLGATAVAAISAGQAEASNRELTFGRAAEAVQRQLVARIETLGSQFDGTLSMLAVTHPTPFDHYDEYVRREVDFGFELDPGVLFVEQVGRDELADLERREHALGNTDFTITTFDMYPEELPAYVITRAASTRDGSAHPFEGFDVLVGQQLLFPQGTDEAADRSLHVLESSWLLDQVLVLPEQRAVIERQVDLPELGAFFVGRVRNADGEALGWGLRFLDSNLLTTGVDRPEHLNLRLTAEGLDRPIAALLSPAGQLVPEPAPDQSLVERMMMPTGGEDWTVEVWADEAFGRAPGFDDQQRVLLIGGGLSVLLALGAAVLHRYRRRLAGAAVELERARTVATTDQLTGLLNRQGLSDAVRHLPADEMLAVFFIDLDGFKAVNDQRGHDAGDAVLAEVARALLRSFRPTDLVCRAGGDEFVVVAPGAGGQLEALADRAVQAVSAVDDAIGASIGIAVSDPGADIDLAGLLRQADQAMYEAKQTGGSRYAVTAAG